MASQKEGRAAGAEKVTANVMFIPKNVFHSQHSPVPFATFATVVGDTGCPLALTQGRLPSTFQRREAEGARAAPQGGRSGSTSKGLHLHCFPTVPAVNFHSRCGLVFKYVRQSLSIRAM